MRLSLSHKLILAGLILVLFGAPLTARGGDIAAEDIPGSAYISGVPGRAQTYALSCESRSASDWAAYWGIAVDESEFLFGMPTSDNPDEGFVGYYNGAWGSIPPDAYGVHAGPVARRLRDYGFEAKARHGMSWDTLRAEIAAGRPVIVWIIGQMWGGSPISYTASDGETTTVARFEHTMILIGYDDSVVHAIDAYTGWTQTYSIQSFLDSWAVLGDMAVTGKGKPSQQPKPEEPNGEETYTVQSGDYLTALARRFNISWEELANRNGINYPYTIYAGQVLIIPGQPVAKPTKTPPPEVPTTPVAPVKAYSISLPLIIKSTSAPAVKAPEPTKTKKPRHRAEETYVVQRGDFLIDIANRFSIDWRVLAEINGIESPYVIYAGQVLKLNP